MTALTDAWQGALSAEQQAEFGYGLLGPQLRGTPQLALAVSCSHAHQNLADTTAQALAAAGQQPVAPQADYPQLYPVVGAAAAEKLAVRLEDGCAMAWRYLYAVAASSAEAMARPLRSSAQAALTASAVRATQWRKVVSPATATVPFPGL